MFNKKKMTKYATISLPKKFVDKINDFITMNPDRAYSSIAEFVKDATRSLLRELEKKKEHLNKTPIEI